MRRFPTGITIITTVDADKPKGFTANAFSSVSADPPTILICVNRRARTHPMIGAAGAFCVNILSDRQSELAERFASADCKAPFEGVDFRVGISGSPILVDALGFFDCSVLEQYAASTHTIFIGNVLQCEARTEGLPLAYYDGGYHDLAPRVAS